MIQFATKAHRQAVISLWQTCFGDTPEDIERYLHVIGLEHALCSFADDQLVSMLFLLKFEIMAPERAFQTNYIYAACTDPEHRGKGLMAALLRNAEDLTRKQGLDLLMLSPATESLFEFYGKHGYRNACSYASYQLNGLPQTESLPHSVPADWNLSKLRTENYASVPHQQMDQALFQFVIDEHIRAGGILIPLQLGGDKGFAVAQIHDETMELLEVCVKPDQIRAAADMIRKAFPYNNYVFHVPHAYKLENRPILTPNGMAIPMHKAAEQALKTEDIFFPYTLG